MHESEFGEPDLAALLTDRRPLPAADFRGWLGRRLAAADPGYGPRPARLSQLILLYVAAGALVFLLGALQALGAL